MTTFAFFGGSFDPPHVGHLLAATWVLSTRRVDRVLVVPTFLHAFGKSLTPFPHRRRMAELAFSNVRGVEVEPIEARLSGPSYTVRTLEHLRKMRPATTWRLMIGSDLVNDLPRWREGARIPELAEPLVVGRGGHVTGDDDDTLLMPEVSSTEVRRRFATGSPVDHLVPRAVRSYALAHGLYGSANPKPESPA